MSQPVTITLVAQTPSTGQNTLITSDKYPAAGYYLSKKDFQTFTWNLTSVTGILTFQATLAEDPGADDWFVVHTVNASSSTQNSYVNITGNFVWVRAVVNNFSHGTIQHIKVSY